MKKIAVGLMMLFAVAGMCFAQSNDLQVLAVVKLNKSESITVKQLKTRVSTYQKQNQRSLSVEEKQQVLDALIDEKLMLQAAQKAGLTVSDTYVSQYFQQLMAAQTGLNISEKELNDLIKQSQGKTLDQLLTEQVGMNTTDYKAYLKNQLIIQQYVLQQRQKEIQAIAATDDEIRMFYESNKKSFVWDDMMKIFMVIVPKGDDADAAKIKLNDLRNKYVDKKLTADQLTVQSNAEGSGYQAGELLLPKTEQGAAAIGMPFQNIILLFSQSEGFVSDIQDTTSDYRFIAVGKKYDAKMLGISDLVQPETTVTVYDYIRSNLSQQKQQMYLQTAAQELADGLDTAENVDRKKSGDALNKLLDWGE